MEINETCTAARALEYVRRKTAVVIPLYIPASVDADTAAALISDTVTSYAAFVDDPARILMTVDGPGNGDAIARDISDATGAALLVLDTNRGKLHAARAGAAAVLERFNPGFVAVVDQDGDHAASELPNFVRACTDITVQTGSDRVLVVGRRITRHHPMGFARGELEEYADRVLLDMLQYHAAQTGTPLPLEYVFALDEFPDFHSGYKLFTATAARDVFTTAPAQAGTDDDCYWRHAVEAVMCTEAVLAGAYLGAVNRSTVNEQPVTTFGQMNRARLVADKIIWPGKRLNIPAPFIAQWLANHRGRLRLSTLVPDGRDELDRIGKLVLDAFGTEPPDRRTEPAFI